MDKATRNTIERATQQARNLLDEDFSSQLEGTFDVLCSGVIASKGGAHLSAIQRSQWDKIVAAIAHKRAAGMTAVEAVADYVRDAAFTTLNRFVALKMLEARELVQECITKGEQSSGYREFCGMAPGIALLPDTAGYRLYIESLFDEFSTEIKVLFDRRDAASVLWPKRQTFEALLSILNAHELSEVWAKDETIGWVYQFFNSGEERKRMRDESQAPRNSRELAVRNQFFTPRYVVQFLTDNTLGRLWLGMRGDASRLNDLCEYLVRSNDMSAGTRPSKDPRDLRIIDPACGSGHFLLYSFDLLLRIYEEAWEVEGIAPRSEATGRTLRDEYPNLADLRRETPRLIVEHNLHGIDIDPRCAQIAALALWLRSHRAWNDLGFPRSERPRIQRTHIVVAEPMPGDSGLVEEFAARLEPPLLRDLFKKIVSEMRHAGELGSLIPVEQGIAAELNRAREQFSKQRKVTGFLPGMESLQKQGELDLSGINDDDFFREAETNIVAALHAFAESTIGRGSVRRRLFSGDAAHGIALIELLRMHFDVVLMNPPFGEPPIAARQYIYEHAPSGKADIGAAFLEVFSKRLCSDGSIGVLLTRALLFHDQLDTWRAQLLLGDRTAVTALADLGYGVLDAVVEVAAFCVAAHTPSQSAFVDCLGTHDKAAGLAAALQSKGGDSLLYLHSLDHFRNVPLFKMAFGASDHWLELFSSTDGHEQYVSRAGLASGNDERMLRAWWEVDTERIEPMGWRWFAKGGEYGKYQSDLHLVVNWRSSLLFRRSGDTSLYGRPGITYTERTTSNVSARVLNRQTAFSYAGPAIVPVSETLLSTVLAVSNSFAVSYLIEIVAGGGDYSVRGSAARHFYPSYFERLPELRVGPDDIEFFNGAMRAVINAQRKLNTDESHIEYCPSLPNSSAFRSLREWIQEDWRIRHTVLEHAYVVLRSVENRVAKLFDLNEGHCTEAYPITGWPWPTDDASPEVVRKQWRFSGLNRESDPTLSAENNRFQNKLSHWLSQDIEATAHATHCSPESICRRLAEYNDVPFEYTLDRVRDLVSWLAGCCFGRFDIRRALDAGGRQPSQDLFDALPPTSPAMLVGDNDLPLSRTPEGYPITFGEAGIFVDDAGHVMDLITAVRGAFDIVFGLDADQWWDEISALLDPKDHELRAWFSGCFFEHHLKCYSKSRRRAPIYWQLGVPSGRYSIWLYAHRLTGDSFFQIYNDVLTPKLAHEERQLISLRRDKGASPSSKERREIADQDDFVGELRSLLEEVKRVAPLWNPVLDDGVILTMAPLWRLVPLHKPWQKELKNQWDELAAGKYDWAHVAMHLWPERVVPKCITDRSIATAHGLEDVFWFEGDDGKWKLRPAPMRPVDEIVRERTSTAVKSALKSLLDVPAASTNGGRRHGHRTAKSAADGGAR